MYPPWILNYFGLPFKTLGRDRSGIDCWGLVKLILSEQCGVEVSDYTDYESEADKVNISKGLNEARFGDRWVRQEVPKEFDVVLFNIYGWPVHIGICIDSEHFIHAAEGDSARIERLSSPIWTKRIEGFYRHVDLPDHR